MLIDKDGQKRSCRLAVCKSCGIEFYAVLKEINKGGGKFCSRHCSRSFQAKINALAMASGVPLYERQKRWRASVPKEVHLAHDAVAAAIANGSLLRMPCEQCGAIRVDAHHDDYAKPLDVRWLCRRHHLAHHRK